MECTDVNVQLGILVHDVNMVRVLIRDNLWHDYVFAW
jgi:hypothetical protein